MADIEKIAASQGVNWETLQRVAPSLAEQVAAALFTRRRFRTSDQTAALRLAHDLSETDPGRAQRDRSLSRQAGVNALEVGRVNGRTLDHGQPRGQRRGLRRR